MRFSMAPSVLLFVLVNVSISAAQKAPLEDVLPLLGHRNWIVVADSAYPAQVSPGVETVYVGGNQIATVRNVLKMIDDAAHIRPIIYTDRELPHVLEADAPGIRKFRKQLDNVLANQERKTLPHEKIIERLDEAGQTYRVTILKTDLTLPYTSVFFQLDAGYWSTAAEKRLRKKIAQASKPNPFAPIVDDPALPRVLLVGDSISIAYTLPVRRLLDGVANVHRPATNCGPTTRGLEQLDDWLGDKEWDVIHFNFGLHDLKYVDDQGARVPPSAGHLQVPQDDYEANLTKIVERLKKTNAKLIWRTTTPVPKGAHGRKVGMSAEYNTIAARVIEKTIGENAMIDDQYTFALDRMSEIQRPADVHFTAEGSEELAEQTVKAILSQLAPTIENK